MKRNPEIFNQRERKNIIRYINLKLKASGFPVYKSKAESEIDTNYEFLDVATGLIKDYKEKSRISALHKSPVDQRIANFLNDYFKEELKEEQLELPKDAFILDTYGLARELSLPPDKNEFSNEYIKSYRIEQGVLHNPKHDRRTTKGTFHIVEGSILVPFDKKEVPKHAFVEIFKRAFTPPDDLMLLPFSSSSQKIVKTFVSLYLKPIVVPEVKGIVEEKRMEIHFFAPGALVSNLDFAESVFGNAGNPFLAENDSSLDVNNWTGHSGCIILAPHLTKLTKKEVGLPHFDFATKRQKKDGMCWKEEGELYNDGKPFKLVCRDDRGVVVSIIADNYFGYTKKEIKSHISYSANLFGLVEEEHSGGAIAFPRKNLGEYFDGSRFHKNLPQTFEFMKKNYSSFIDFKEENYGIDKNEKTIVYIPENAEIDLYKEKVKWEFNNKLHEIKLLFQNTYVYPSGLKINMERNHKTKTWNLISTWAEGTFCHKPATVSGGGKSEISKPLDNAIVYGKFHIDNFEEDFKKAIEVLNYDFSNRWKDSQNRTKPSRGILAQNRTLGSVIKLLTPSELNTDEFVEFANSIPNNIKSLIFFIKKYYSPDWGDDWIKFFSVDLINGRKGNSLYFKEKKILVSHVRMGFAQNNSWLLQKLRTDFIPAEKLQMEDDITASITVRSDLIEHKNPFYNNFALKFVENCEYRFFQRPDEAIHRGYDKGAEADLALKNIFVSNYEPLTPKDAVNLMEEAIGFYEYTEPIREVIRNGAKQKEGTYFISSSHPRIVDGKMSKNPRYLQLRQTFSNPKSYYLAEISTRLSRQIPNDKEVYFPVNAVLPARRNNPFDKKENIPPLSVYNPLHYQELPELFMDFISSLSGKSPSTTGAGSEGALTKGPFNMLSGIIDLNNALLSFILTEYNGFSTPAGFIGQTHRVDHDISIFIPEIWSLMNEDERNPRKWIEEGSLEKLEDFEYKGKKIEASRLGYRITKTFLINYCGKMFEEPDVVFPETMLKPEKDDLETFVKGIENILNSHKKVAKTYIDEKSVNMAIPPLKALIYIMAEGEFEGMTLKSEEFRKMFTKEYVLSSDWYKERLVSKQRYDEKLLNAQIEYMEKFLSKEINKEIALELNLFEKLKFLKQKLKDVSSEGYLEFLKGTIGRDVSLSVEVLI